MTGSTAIRFSRGRSAVADARTVAVRALDTLFREDGYANLVLGQALTAASLDGRDAAFASALFYGALERHRTLEYVIAAASGRPWERIDPACRGILLVASCQLLYMDKVPASAAVNEAVKQIKHTKKSYLGGFVNAVLRKIERDKSGFLPPADRPDLVYSCEPTLIASLLSDYGEEAAFAVLEHSLIPAPTVLRVNPLKTTDEAFLSALEADGREPTLAALHTVILGKPGSLENTSWYRDGLFHVQSRASALAAEALEATPGDRVLDCCAAPGGKTFTVAELMGDRGEIVAGDCHAHRVALIEAGAARLGLSSVHPRLLDAAAPHDTGLFDRVLCDVPCSGLGMMAEKPDIKDKTTASFADLPPLQTAILTESASHLKPGGRLVYSTCTLRRAENEAVTAAFLAEHPAFRLLSEKTYFPHIDGTSGFYIAVMERDPLDESRL